MSNSNLYKYIRRQHLDEFRKKGTVCLRSIAYFRSVEKAQIGDPYEGRTEFIISTSESEEITLTPSQANALTNEYVIKSNITFGPNTYFKDFLDVSNAFLFCTSMKMESKLMADMGYDTFYTIVDANSYAKVLADSFRNKYGLRSYIAGPVKYVQTKTIQITNENKSKRLRSYLYENQDLNSIVKMPHVDDYLTKTLDFGGQYEFRFVFVPTENLDDDYVLLECPELLQYCFFSE